MFDLFLSEGEEDDCVVDRIEKLGGDCVFEDIDKLVVGLV